MTDACIQCRRTVAELAIGHAEYAPLLWRPRPMLRNSEYAICVACARAVKISDSAKATQGESVLAGASTTYSPVRVNGGAGKLSERGRGNP